MSLELLSLGLDFVGGLMGRNRQDEMHARQMKQSQAQFDAQMDTSVQRRVKDAKSAGIHPLFAMGASVGASPTISSGGAPERSPMADAIGKMANTLGVIEMNRASARKDEAEAALYDSEKARIDQQLTARGSDTPTVKTYGMGEKPGPGFVLGPAEYYAPEVSYSSSPGVRAGPIPENVQLMQKDGRKLDVLNSEAGLDEIAQVDYVVQKARQALADQMESNDMFGKVMAQDREIARLEKEWNQLRASRKGTPTGLHSIAKQIASRLYALARRYRKQ